MRSKEGSPGQAEAQAPEQLDSALREHLNLANEAFNLIGAILRYFPEVAVDAMPRSLLVAVKLLLRLSNDLRCVGLLAARGYPVQALSLVASMHEVAFAMGFIGSDESLARDWINHDDPTRPFCDHRTMIREALVKLGVPDPDAQGSIEYRTYTQLCMAKHANPLFEMGLGWELREGKVIFVNGPDCSEVAVRPAWFALEHAAGLAFIAMATFLNVHLLNHLSRDTGAGLTAEVEAIGAKRKNLEAAAKATWGTEDPFPGRWRS